jgi:hypothetical protein
MSPATAGRQLPLALEQVDDGRVTEVRRNGPHARQAGEQGHGVARHLLGLAMRQTQAVDGCDGAEGHQQLGGGEARHAERGAGEDLEESDPCLPEGLHLVTPAGPGGRRQAEVDQGAIAQVADLLPQVGRRADRVAVRVLDDRGHPADGRGAGSGNEVLARRVTRVLEVNVAIYRTGRRYKPAQSTLSRASRRSSVTAVMRPSAAYRCARRRPREVTGVAL